MVEPFTVYDIPVGQFALAPPRGLGLCGLPGRCATLDDDLITIRHWAPTIVVSATEPAEMADFGVAGLARGLHQFGIMHASFAIPDFATPPADMEWPGLSRRLHGVLDSGGRVLLHCLGGKGRSGMIALRLLVERGAPPPAALAAIRSVRPGAVETAEQQRWAAAGR